MADMSQWEALQQMMQGGPQNAFSQMMGAMFTGGQSGLQGEPLGSWANAIRTPGAGAGGGAGSGTPNTGSGFQPYPANGQFPLTPQPNFWAGGNFYAPGLGQGGNPLMTSQLAQRFPALAGVLGQAPPQAMAQPPASPMTPPPPAAAPQTPVLPPSRIHQGKKNRLSLL